VGDLLKVLSTVDITVMDQLTSIVILATAQRLKLDPSAIQLSSSFIRDLGADSLSFVEIVMALEDRLGVSVPDRDLEQLNTVQDLCEYLFQRIDKAAFAEKASKNGS